jgi:multiple sugar transport system ATP-binding protein
MNFIPGTLKGSAEEMTLEADTLQIKLPPERSRRLAPHSGAEVQIGIRPEDMHDPDFLPPRVRGYPIRARVDVTEMMGNEKFLHLIIGTSTMLARVDPRTRARAGQDIDLTLDIDRLHVFDANTGVALDKIEMPEEMREIPAVG